MKKRIVKRVLLRVSVVGLLLVWLPSLHAQRVLPENARKAAQTFLQGCGGRSANASELSDITEVLGFSNLYAFNGSKGYVVLAAEGSVSPVLCFSPDGHIDATHLPEGMHGFLQDYDAMVRNAVEQGIQATPETVGQWNDLIAGRTEGLQTRESVGPLLSTKWGQEDPYNLQCPMNTEVGLRCTTGSVATAMAQIMKYWEHPKQGKGNHDDYAGDNLYLYGYDALTANFGETTYDWQHMRDHYGVLTFASDEEKQAVAELMFHCGVAVDMLYDYDNSTFFEFDPEHQGSHLQSNASYYKVGEALIGNFYYKCPTYEERFRYTDEQWTQMIKDALTASPPRPIHMIMEHAYSYSQYFGYSFNTIGYVCDGYKTVSGTDYMHINWGLGGLLNSGSFNNGYYRIVDGFQFPGYDKAYFGIEPDSANVAVSIAPMLGWGLVYNSDGNSFESERFPKGNTITLHAEPLNGMHFEKWSKNGVTVSTIPELTFKVESDVTYTAEFAKNQFNVTAEVIPAEGGTVIGTGTYYYNEHCQLQALPNPGYAFEGWYKNGELWSNNSYLEFHVMQDWNLTACFIGTNYTVNLSPVPFASSGTVSGAGTYSANSTVTVMASPTSGHQFRGWVENGTVVCNSPSYAFTLQSDRNLLAVFGSGSQSGIGSVVTNADGSRGVLFHIDLSGMGWMVAMDDASEGCPWGPTTNIDALPDYPCNNMFAMADLSGMKNTSILRTALGTDNDYAASKVDFDHGWYLPSAGQLRKLYAALSYVDSVLYRHGGTTLSEEAYWSSTEFSSSDAFSPVFAMSNSNKGTNHRVRAIRNYFSPQDNVVLALPDSPTRGEVMNYHNGVYAYGEQAAVVALPKAGYEFDHWSEDGMPVSHNKTYTFTFTHSRRLVAHFVVAGSIGTIVQNPDGSQGVVFYLNQDGTEGLMVALEDASEGCPWGTETNIPILTDHPTNSTLGLEDMSGYHNTGILRTIQGIDSAYYAATVVDYDNGWYLPASGELRKLYAMLPMIESALTLAGGTSLAEGPYWSSTEYSTSDAATPSFYMGNTAKTSSCRVRAIRKFAATSANAVVVKADNELMGTVSGSGNYEYYETVTASAEPNEGYKFSYWTECGVVVSYDATYHFPFTRNCVLVAHFTVPGAVGDIVHNADGSTGVVFYQNAESTEGWMVALQDASEGCPWGPEGNIHALPDFPSDNIVAFRDYSGNRNTSIIRKMLGTDNEYAASVVDFANGWYLPSAGQLRKLYAVWPMIEESILNAGGTPLTEDAYWSSTEFDASNACSPMFAMSNTNKASLLRVRAVRTFNCASTNLVRLKANNPAAGVVTGAGLYELGAMVRIIATPNPGYVFDHWEEDGCTVSYNRLYTFEFTRTRTLVAVFVRENSVGSIVHNDDGTDGIVFYVYPSGAGGLMVALEDASEGCPWGPDEDVIPLENQAPSAVMELLDEMNGRNNTSILRGWFMDNPDYAASKVGFANGWYLPSAGQLRKLYAALPLIEKAIVDAGGTSLTEDAYWSSSEQSSSNAWTPSFAMGTTNKTNNCRVRAIRSVLGTRTIATNVNIEGGGTVVGDGEYDQGQNCTLRAQANDTYAFLNWTCDRVVVSTNPEYNFMVTGNQTYTANFVANSSNITAVMDPAGSGTVTGGGVYQIGETCTLSATPDAGYTFYSWSCGNYQVSTEPSFSFTVVGSAQYTAHFVINSYAIDATAFPAEGGSISGSHAYNHGSTAILTATPAAGYTFVNWTENGAVVSTSPTLQFEVYGNRTLVANFSANNYTVTAVALPSDGGTIEGDGDYAYGTTATLTAHPNPQFDFFCWFEDDDVLSYAPSVSFEVTEDHEIYAVFNESQVDYHFMTAGNWSQASNWSSGALPGVNDEVFIDANCTLNRDAEVASLTVTAGKTLTLQAGNTLTVTGTLANTATTGLVIEDGAQLVNASGNVAATMEKSISAHEGASTGWYTIASPMSSMSIAGSGFVTPEYDLYRFNETNLTSEEWENHKAGFTDFTTFEKGRGYLYANNNDFTPTFTGILNASFVTYSLTHTERPNDPLSGFNLIGNPFPHDIYKGVGGAIDNVNLASGYYTLDNDGTWQVHTFEDAIHPGQGILVKATAPTTLTIAKSNEEAFSESGDAKKGMDRLCISVVGHDRAYVYFGQGVGLDKKNDFNIQTPSLWIRENGKDYAIAHADGAGESLELCFGNKQVGDFTLTIEASNAKFKCLQLIDHVTGATVDLLKQPAYSFHATGQEPEARFGLMFKLVVK